MPEEYFEDLEIGDTREFGSYEVTKPEVLEFAEQYDPQPFHVDEAAAEQSMFGGLIASGWHTASMTMRMLVDNVMAESKATGAVGVDDLRWSQPVRPGDTLTVETEVLDKEPNYMPGIGLVRSGATVYADGTQVMSFVGLVLYQMREPEQRESAD
ncbi:MaoC family dehydratase [Halorarius litoreus]|uniref:MaoC family dehydratase n=1 Tax=Halorarius litoreus TaxID=2962676 RepID=UPI0020CE6C91|nr:MaoC family dehydratase [Halorarius litoreus]